LELTHSLKGLFYKHGSQEEIFEKKKLYPLKMYLTTKRTRSLYFDDKKALDEVFKIMKEQSGQRDFKDFYSVSKLLGSGQYGKVYLATRTDDN